jgi:two-component system alkaline phosphatase synthesis response regulator PhoP
MVGRILIIDDEPELVKAVEVRLKACGYDVEVAYDGKAGIDKAKDVRPDLILLDFVMPTMDGYEVARELMADLGIKRIPIIVLTASQQRDLKIKFRELGIHAFIVKPFETSDLLNMVNQYLSMRGDNR